MFRTKVCWVSTLHSSGQFGKAYRYSVCPTKKADFAFNQQIQLSKSVGNVLEVIPFLHGNNWQNVCWAFSVPPLSAQYQVSSAQTFFCFRCSLKSSNTVPTSLLFDFERHERTQYKCAECKHVCSAEYKLLNTRGESRINFWLWNFCRWRHARSEKINRLIT